MKTLPKKFGSLVLCDFETTGLNAAVDHPIEVALLFLDHEFRVIHAYESLIVLPEWKEEFWDAVPIHGITLNELSRYGQTAGKVAEDIFNLCERVKGRKVLCSDCAVFETRFMEKLLKNADGGDDWPFHYSTWDTNLFLEVGGPGDPIPAHRAMADVGLLYEKLLEAVR